jgi:phage I-like protein
LTSSALARVVMRGHDKRVSGVLQRVCASALAINGEEPPGEFRIFPAGRYGSTKGEFVFDEAAAREVLAQVAREGVDLMIDLEHQSLNAPDARPDTSDARGWFNVELRDNGELWAVNVRWTPDGERRLREKTQRYISPAFEVSKDERRVVRLLNVALVAMPATFDAQPLVAASKANTGHVFTAAERGRMYVNAVARRKR